ncbi:hypothetical protein Gotur_030987 [Gossypium turneri]
MQIVEDYHIGRAPAFFADSNSSYELTDISALMSLPFQLDRACRSSARNELTDHGLKEHK